MVKLEEDYWQKIIKDYEGSGLSQNDFCIQQGIPVAQFKYRWRREMDRTSNKKERVEPRRLVAVPRFEEVSILGADSVASSPKKILKKSWWLWYNSTMKMTPNISVFSPEFQAILAPSQLEEIELLQQETQEWKDKYHHLLEQLRLSQQRQFSRSSEANVLQGELIFDEADAVDATELPQEENTVTVTVTYTRKKPVRALCQRTCLAKRLSMTFQSKISSALVAA